MAMCFKTLMDLISRTLGECRKCDRQCTRTINRMCDDCWTGHYHMVKGWHNDPFACYINLGFQQWRDLLKLDMVLDHVMAQS